MIHTLQSNIETVKAQGLEAKSHEISISVLTKDLLEQTEDPTFYATRYGMIYNPSDFKPINVSGGQKLKSSHIDFYYEMLPEARAEYKKVLAALKGGGNGEKDSTEIADLKKQLAGKEARIAEQTEKIAELMKTKKDNENSSQVDKLEKMINTLSEIQSNRIEIVMQGKATKTVEKIVHEQFKDILKLIAKGRHVYLHGPSGTGKSELAKQISEALELDYYPASTVTQEFKISGYKDANGTYHETNFYRAFKNGGLFFLDEMDSCSTDVLVGINGALANGYYDFPEGVVYAHENFRCIAAGNTIGRGANETYTGRQVLDASTIDRFLALPLDYSPAIDKAVAKNDMDLVDFANALRQSTQELGITLIMSYRAIGNIVSLTKEMDFDLVEAMQMSVIKGIATDDVLMLARNMNIDSSNKYYKAFKKAA